jgi:teichuronic acid biosynthesis glycosyltransferase TuaC
MKVAVVTQYFPTSQQVWAGHSAYQTLRMLARLCDLHVFYPEAVYPAGLAPSAGRRVPLDRTWEPEGVHVSYIPYLTLPVIGRPLNGLTMTTRLLPHVRAYAPDVILNYVIYPDGLAATNIARRLGVPSVLTAIGSDLNRIPGRLVKSLTQRALRQASVVTTVSHDLARTAIALGSHSAHTQAILNGCDTSVFHPGNPDEASRADARKALGVPSDTEAIVYVGRLDVRKGLLELVEAMAGLRGRRPNAHCYIVGDGPDRPAILEAVTRLDAQAAVTLVPSCPTSGVARWMAAADLVTLPSYKEGCPNVVIEALAAGRPVVATNVGGIPELMDHSCGRLIPAKDPAALLQALDETLEQTWDAHAISQRHSRSWADVAHDLHQMLLQAVDQNSANKTSY